MSRGSAQDQCDRSYYDLHIHSCLSPCAEDEMTPNNIAGMAHIKGLNIISVTDHNSCENLPACAAAAAQYGLVFVPGIEVTSVEEVHVLVYFSSIDNALRFGRLVYDSLPDTPNRPDIFGNQYLMDADDHITGTTDKLLLLASTLSVDDIVTLAKEFGGCAVAAHINRDSFSLISNLGFIPNGLFSTVEVYRGLPSPTLPAGMQTLHSSDAHRLGDLSEPDAFLQGIASPAELVAYLAGEQR